MTTGKCKESLLLYGSSGAGKTTQAGNLAMWLRRRYPERELKVRLVSCSGGGWSSIQPAIDLGLVDPLFIGDFPYPFETLDRVTKGWWPLDPENPSQLSPPKDQKEWGNVGAVFFDSITEIADWLMRYTVNREATDATFKTSAQTLAVKFKDGTTNFGTPGLSHYGTIQNALSQFIAQSKTLNGRYIGWTALELKATDEVTRMPMYGPDIIGRAKTSQASAWFDNTLHLTFDPIGEKEQPTRRIYLSTHFEDGIPYVAKNRGHFLSPLPQVLEGRDHDIGKFLDLLAESHKKAAELMAVELRAMKPQQTTKQESK